MEFVAVDVETANASMSSICQVGIATFRDGVIVDEWESLVNPEDFFDPFNSAIHGITESTVEGAPTFAELIGPIRERLEGRVAVCHTHFDRIAIGRALRRYDVHPFDCRWLDSARVTRRTWPQFAYQGYGLANACAHIGYEYEAHDALEDAKAAGVLILAAIHESGLSVDDWLRRVAQPIHIDGANVKRDGDPDGPLFGAVMVFTGALQITRREAADLAARLGCTVTESVTKKTTYLVVGDQDVARLAGHEKSSKHRRAEELAIEGYPLRVLAESDFLELVASASGPSEASS